MDCAQHTPESDDEFFNRLWRKVRTDRIPLSGGMNLTHRCNLRCVHCYIRPPAGREEAAQELPTRRWLEILDEVTAAGCLFFLMTGGEPLLRPDFPEIYRKARRNGLFVTVFTNGTLVDDAILDLFTEYPPTNIDITLYGATEATYERITQVPGSYRQCMTAVTRLRERGVALSLKSVLLNLNAEEFKAIESLAREFDDKFRMDAYIVPRMDGVQTPVDFRVRPGQAVEIDFGDAKRTAAWLQLYQNRARYHHSETAYDCGAGKTGFHIDAFGHLQICMMEQRWWYDLKTGSFQEGWQQELPRIIKRPAPPDDPCRKCPDWLLCQACKPQIVMETGSETVPPRFLCELGRARQEKVKAILGDGDSNGN